MAEAFDRQQVLKLLPGVDRLLLLIADDLFYDPVPKRVLVDAVRQAVDGVRAEILAGEPRPGQPLLDEAGIHGRILANIRALVIQAMTPNLRPVINATGVVVHTNLGRSLLAPQALDNLSVIGGGYSNLEFDLARGRRGSRYVSVEALLCEITGAEAAMVVNNNAGAVLLCLETLAKDREVVVSRGELVEIGGAFRIPDVMARSGALLKEVGTTNRTHARDYEAAVGERTALFLKVHQSNYAMVGFTAAVSLPQMVALGARYHIPVMEDLGSGTFIDFSAYGLKKEPLVQESVAAGVDVITFSGDKLLGGPQAGIIIGKHDIIEKIRKNPVTRALRIDKLTLAALESTLRLYRDPQHAVAAIPTLRMLLMPPEEIAPRAEELARRIDQLAPAGLHVEVLDRTGRAGGGALPLLELPGKCIALGMAGWSANAMEAYLRRHRPPIIGRIEEDRFLLDLRTIQDDEFDTIVNAFTRLTQEKDDNPT